MAGDEELLAFALDEARAALGRVEESNVGYCVTIDATPSGDRTDDLSRAFVDGVPAMEGPGDLERFRAPFTLALEAHE